MPPPAISPATRYTSRGTAKWYWVVTIANYLAPSTGELNAGTDLSPEVMDSAGFGTDADQIKTPDVATRFNKSIPGIVEADECTLTMYATPTGADARTLMPRDTAGYVVVLPGGQVTGRRMSVWPVRVASVKPQYGTSGSDPDTLLFKYAVTGEPAENILVP